MPTSSLGKRRQRQLLQHLHQNCQDPSTRGSAVSVWGDFYKSLLHKKPKYHNGLTVIEYDLLNVCVSNYCIICCLLWSLWWQVSNITTSAKKYYEIFDRPPKESVTSGEMWAGKWSIKQSINVLRLSSTTEGMWNHSEWATASGAHTHTHTNNSYLHTI